MNYFRNTAIFISVLLATNVLAKDLTYLCVSEEATGFHYENGSWRGAHFNVSDDKYIIRKIKETEYGFKDKKNPYGVFQLGGKSPAFMCSISEHSNRLTCRISLGQFFFSPESGRFLRTYTTGYWDGEDNNDNNPYIARGRCSII